MPTLSKPSEAHLLTCHPDLQRLIREAIKHVDFTVMVGYRNQEDQEEAFRLGNTTKHWPDSRHNTNPSTAVDIAPYPVDWSDTARFARLYGYIERIAEEMNIGIRWGGDWNNNYRTKDETLVDMPHIELVNP